MFRRRHEVPPLTQAEVFERTDKLFSWHIRLRGLQGFPQVRLTSEQADSVARLVEHAASAENDPLPEEIPEFPERYRD
ncbi:MAG: hypothetical protein ACXWLH_00650 [Candidatus Saccharimonadales bacterium]